MSDLQFTVLVVVVVLVTIPPMAYITIKLSVIGFLRGRQRYFQIFDNEKEKSDVEKK